MKIFLRALSMLALAAFLAVTPLVLNKKFIAEKAPKERDVVLVLWHLDTFEGGTGSRQEFLMRTAVQFEKEHGGVYVSVIKHTEESLEAAFKEGNVPDLVSFGIGTEGVAERAKPLKTHKNNAFFASASSGGQTYFYPYAYGRYVLFTSAAAKAEGTVVSCGKNNLPLFAARSAGLEYDEVKDTLSAYADFAAGKFANMLGTQRDIYRLRARGAEFTCSPLGDITDLVQYIAVTADDPNRAALAGEFAEYLLSDGVQGRLGEIGLFSPTGAAVDYGAAEMNALAAEPPSRVLSALIGGERRELKAHDGQDDFFEKFENYLVQ